MRAMIDEREFTQTSWLRALRATADIARKPGRILPVVIEEVCRERADAPAVLAPQAALSYSALADRIAHYAHWALSQDIRPGDCVGLLMPTSPDYLAAWLGISRIGGVVALLNVNVQGRALAHAIGAVDPRRLIIHDSFLEQLETARPFLPCLPSVWVHGEKACGLPRVDVSFGAFRDDPLPDRGVTIADRALYIFTSGTTGLPKAALVSHRRALTWSLWFSGLLGIGPDDRMYDCLPLHHSVGGVVATGAMLVGGGSVFLRDRFSASAFWTDVCERRCTLFQYIGELCRYLLNSPTHPQERAHAIRLCCGNGMRQDVWSAFKQRFAIPRVLEFYASTEGNVSLYNVEGKVGSIGRIPAFSPQRGAVALVKLDAEDQPMRDGAGLCVACQANEPGEALGRISTERARGSGEFEGYASEADTQRKILRDVIRPGDAWFRTGDLMRRDAEGFYYFIDRLGDTFRWKGENVATLEVAEALCACPGVREAIVYGAALPGCEGRAGMALIVAERALCLDEIVEGLEARLPAYARPIFLRLRNDAELTETFKYKKAALGSDGFDPRATDDPLFYYDAASKSYRPLNLSVYARIQAGELSW